MHGWLVAILNLLNMGGGPVSTPAQTNRVVFTLAIGTRHVCGETSEPTVVQRRVMIAPVRQRRVFSES